MTDAPAPITFGLAVANELWARVTKRPALISLATVQLPSAGPRT